MTAALRFNIGLHIYLEGYIDLTMAARYRPHSLILNCAGIVGFTTHGHGNAVPLLKAEGFVQLTQ